MVEFNFGSQQQQRPLSLPALPQQQTGADIAALSQVANQLVAGLIEKKEEDRKSKAAEQAFKNLSAKGAYTEQEYRKLDYSPWSHVKLDDQELAATGGDPIKMRMALSDKVALAVKNTFPNADDSTVKETTEYLTAVRKAKVWNDQVFDSTYALLVSNGHHPESAATLMSQMAGQDGSVGLDDLREDEQKDINERINNRFQIQRTLSLDRARAAFGSAAGKQYAPGKLNDFNPTAWKIPESVHPYFSSAYKDGSLWSGVQAEIVSTPETDLGVGLRFTKPGASLDEQNMLRQAQTALNKSPVVLQDALTEVLGGSKPFENFFHDYSEFYPAFEHGDSDQPRPTPTEAPPKKKGPGTLKAPFSGTPEGFSSGYLDLGEPESKGDLDALIEYMKKKSGGG